MFTIMIVCTAIVCIISLLWKALAAEKALQAMVAAIVEEARGKFVWGGVL